MNDIYDAPQSDITQSSSISPTKPGILIKICLVLFTILSCGISFLSQFNTGGGVSFAIGGGVAPIIVASLIVGLFQIGKGFRNTKSRYKIFMWCQIIFFISKLPGYSGNALTNIEQNTIKSLESIANKINEKAPIYFDSEITLEKASVGPGAKITCFYTLPNYNSSSIDSANLVKEIKANAIKKYCNDKSLISILKSGGVFTFSYSGNDKKFITSFDVIEKDCTPSTSLQ